MASHAVNQGIIDLTVEVMPAMGMMLDRDYPLHNQYSPRESLTHVQPRFSAFSSLERMSKAAGVVNGAGLPLPKTTTVVTNEGEVVDLSDIEGPTYKTSDNQLIDLTKPTTDIFLTTDNPVHLPGPQLPLPSTIKIKDISVGKGRTIELADGEFLQVTDLSRDFYGNQVVRGHMFARSTRFGRRLPTRQNELVWLTSEGEVSRRVDNLDPVRNRQLIRTNKSFEALSLKNHVDRYPSSSQNILHGPLFCRLKYIEKARLSSTERLFQFLSEEEAQVGYTDSRNVARTKFRGFNVALGGSSTSRSTVFDDEGRTNIEQKSEYTFGDAFCGGGGASCGAQMAGLRVSLAFDHDADAISTYQLNYRHVQCYNYDVHDLIQRGRTNRLYVDVLHISPPCQPFSPVNTTPNEKNDETNQAAFLAVYDLIEVIKPRIVTIEEAAGLCTIDKHGEWYARLLSMFIQHDYSTRWMKINCSNFGVPQRRRERLLLIAAAPGESLPEFPAITHAEDPTGTNLKKTPTIRQSIAEMDGLADHDPAAMTTTDSLPSDENTLAYTVTCSSGAENYHPSGLRRYTPRELACLQTFPRTYRFAQTSLTAKRRQIGNAFPPKVAKALFKGVLESLQRADAAELATQPVPALLPEPMLIDLD